MISIIIIIIIINFIYIYIKPFLRSWCSYKEMCIKSMFKVYIQKEQDLKTKCNS